MAFLEKRSERPRVVAPRRVFFSEAVANAPLIDEEKKQHHVHGSQGGRSTSAALKRPKLTWQVRTELYAPVLARVAPPPTPPPPSAPAPGSDHPVRDLWVVAEDEWGNVIPLEQWGPSLPTAEEALGLQMTRRVSIERHMRQFAHLSVRDMLADVPAELLQASDDDTNFLPLHVFDDEDYDCRTWQEWLDLGKVGDEQRPVPVEAFAPQGAQGGRWVDAGAVAYDPEAREWTVVDQGGEQHRLPRLHIRFRAEDPALFCQRFREAVEMRYDCEAAIRFHLFVDCMPVDDMDDMDQNSLERILRLGLRDGALRVHDDLSVPRVEAEIRYSYKRTMCQMLLAAEVERHPAAFEFVTVPAGRPPEKVRERGTAEAAGLVDLPRRRAHAHQQNLFAIPEAYAGLSAVVQECDRVGDQLLFTAAFGKNVTLDEFAAQQTQTTTNVIGNLQTQWLQVVRDNLCMCLGDVGKGWYNLQERRWDIYLLSKMHRLLAVTRLRMECALHRMVTQSVAVLVAMVEAPCRCCLAVDDDFVWGLELTESPFKAAAGTVFQLHLKMEEAGPFLTTKPEQFEEVVLQLFDSAVRASHTLPPVDPLLMTRLVYPAGLALSSVGLQEPWVDAQRARLQEALRRAAVPLRAYCHEYHRFRDFYNLKVAEVVSQYESAQHTAAEFKEELKERIKLRDNLVRTVPASITIGPFLVNVEQTRTALVNKSQELVDRMLHMFARVLRAQLDAVLDGYTDIMAKMVQRPNSIEHIVEIRELVESAPYLIRAQEEVTRRLLFEYEVLDYFWFALSDDDFSAKWEAVAWPHKLSLLKDKISESLAAETAKFLSIHIGDEADHQEQIEFLTDRVAHLRGESNFEKVHELAIEISRIWKLMKECQEQGLLMNRRQKLFDLPVTPYDDLNRLVKEFQPYKDLWTTASEWVQAHEIWLDNPLANVDGDSVERIIADSHKTMTRLARTFAELPLVQKVAVEVRAAVDDFRPRVPLLLALRSPGLHQSHFDRLREETGISIKQTPQLTFKMCLEAGVQAHADRVVLIAETAAKEFSIECALEKIEKESGQVVMEVQPYKNTGTYIMRVTDEELQMLDDHILALQQMSFSPFVGAFGKAVAEWEARLRLISEVLEEWIQLQIQWMYLEPIFCSEDIARQLPFEMKKYGAVERFWRRTMRTAFDLRKVVAVCPDKRLLEQLKESRGLLEQVLKGLSEYLEEKRTAFPRFYFLSDDELLEILSQNRNPLAVQPHLKKCFENINRLHFEDDLRITTMFSAEGESVELIPHMHPTGNVEVWLGKVEDAMRSSVRETLGLALDDMAGRSRADWVLRWPGQVVIAGCQTAWTAAVEEAVREGTLPDCQRTMHDHMDTYRGLVRGRLSRLERQVMSALIVIELHARDVLDGLVGNKTASVNDFDWISQLRYYWVEDEVPVLLVRAVNAEFQYGYEYLGNSGRLVITPLTDRCYLTLTGALHLHFGGAPAGPAGTGKTETTKDLAKAMAIQCVVFNCSDQLDVQAMCKFFKGIASAGAWACFDEFNRIDIEVLSVVAQQVVSIQKAQAARMQRFMFEGVEIALKPAAAVFITMNPGYAGRTELPDNLKALFRPVAMMVPNYTLIAEISLFSFGFSDARQLANKITTTFKLSSEQLSSQDHYDFGMRAVKTVIAVAGNLKREKPDMGEPQIVLRAIRDVNVPKFLRDDLKLFNGIVSDLFPRLQEEQVDYGALLEAVRRVCLQKGLEDVSEFMQKVVQLYDTTVVRHGLMLVGPTGSGKTKCYEVLRDAVTQLSGQQSPSGSPFTPVRTHVINPKAITLGQLYGEFDAVTHEWTDGILPSLVRGGAAAADADKRWYVFDGPVDAVWIENLNTVLDDNKKLCLTSGEIIKLSEHMTMVFEVADLAVASPATVSRCGMVYLDPSVLGLSPFLECWLRNLPPAGREAHPRLEQDLRALLTTFLLGGVSALRGASQGAELVEILASVDVCLVQGCLRLLDARLAPLRGPRPPPAAPFMALLPDLLAPWVALAVVWSVGATCDGASRPMFSQWLRAAMAQHGAGPAFPDEGLVYDYRLHDGGFQDPTDNGEPAAPRWLHWMHGGAPYVIPEHARYSDIEVPTVDTVRSAALLELLVTRGHNVACVGPTGTGKTLTVTAKLGRGLPEKFVADFLCFSARTSAGQTQDVIDAKLDRRRKGVFGPPPTKRQLLFIDDFNMPAPEEYGAQPPIELIRQWLDFQGWYDRKAVGDFHQIVDVNLVVAMGPAGGGRSAVTPRALRHFHCLAFNELEPHSKAAIFGTVARWWLSRTERLLPELDRLVSATLDVYDVVLRELLPTPTKTHYTFNLRDLSKVFQGMLMANPKAVVSLEQLLVLWYHENLRVYQDRLVSDKDRSWFGERLRSVLRGRFNQDHIGEETLYFGDVCSPEREYVRITDVDKLSAALRELLDDYNSQSTAPMRLVLFTDAVQHVCRIARVLRQPQGNALLLGMGGSGRQSLTRLAAFASELTCFRVELSRAYGPAEWRADVKQLLLKAGLHMKEVVFLFSDTQIKSESFLEDLNNVLSSGDVPNIYEAEELDKIYQLMRGVVTDQGLQATRSNMFSAFQRLIKSNLHCIITMSPIGDVFRARLRMFPALVNCCTIDWFSAWPDHALQSVATRFLGDIPGMEVAAVRAGVVAVCQVMHSSAAAASERFQRELSRHFYVTPTSYLELLTSYADLLAKKRAELDQGIRRLRGGLHKLQSTAEEVAVLQQDLTAMRPALARAQGEAAAMLNKIAADTVRAERARHEVEKEESAATEKSGVCAAIAADAEADLAEALPALLDAERSLKALNKNDISEVRALKKPPGGVVLVIEAICIAMGVAPNRVPGPKIGEKVNDFWTPGMTLLASPDQFLSSLVNYDKENMAEDTIRKLRPYIENPNFQPRSVVKVSKACGSLCVWTHAVFRFYFVYQVVKPKKEKLAEANKELEATQQALQATRGKMAKILAGLEALREELRRTEVEMAELEARAQLCEDRLDRARRLLGGVASERGRWAATVEALESGKKLLIGDILVSAGAVAYLTAFTDRYRRELLRRWVSALSAAAVPHSEACSPVSTLADPVSVRLWQVDGLPRDALSTENAVLVAYSHRWPLFIDPQGQANRWIRNTFKDKTLTVLRLSDGHLMRSLETAIRYGFPALLESVGEELDPALDPVLARATFQQGQAGLVIKLGDALVPYHSDFRLYITTKLPNPHYLPELAIKVLLVNFALVPGGLTDQLLGLVVMEERPDLEEARSAIITSTAQMKLELKEIEDRTLELLSASDGSPVDDIDLILSLEASKQKSEEILAKVEASEETKREIEATRVGYLPVANRAQILYFCLYDLSRLDPMYQYSLEWFTAIFVASVRGSPKEDSLERRIRAVNDAFTFSLYGNVCRSLFERHKLWFGVLLCARILLDLGRIHPAEWHFFLAAGTPDAAEANPAPNWLSARAWAELLAMRKLERLREFAEAVPRNIAHYKAMFDSPLPHREKLPEPWEGRLDGFQRLLLLRALRPDKLAEGLQDWLTRGLGARFVEPQATDLATMFADASPTIPLVFVLSTGTDPAQELFQFADKMRMSKRLGVISLGQGQGPRAERLLLQAAEEGSWVFFQNCHLAPSWMPRLEQLLEGITDDTAHRDFRIWLTSTPSPAFPVSILQASSKMTVEPPRGVKANLLRAFHGQIAAYEDFFNSEHSKALPFRRLALSLALFHATVLERRRFGPLGFNIPYEFTEGDLRICLSQLHMFLLEYHDVPIKVMRYTAGQINYGGRVTDDWDRRTVGHLLGQHYDLAVVRAGHEFEPTGTYRQLPDGAVLQDYVNYARALPLNDSPELFGLHPNADISCAQSAALAGLGALLSLQPRAGGGAGSGAGGEADNAEQAALDAAGALLRQIPHPLDVKAVMEKYPVMYEESFNTVLVQEVARFNRLLATVTQSLHDLARAVRGLVVMSATLEAVADAISANAVPGLWAARAYPSLKPLAAWVADLRARVAFLEAWAAHGTPPAFWISGFFFPQAFLTGALQNYARKHVVPIDTVGFTFKVLKERPAVRPPEGCVIYGLFMEGARWDPAAASVTESLPKELYTSMPPIQLVPEAGRAGGVGGAGGAGAPDVYVCPVYKTLQRAGTLSTTGHSTNYVLAVELASRRPQGHWVGRGVALVCALDY